VVEETLSGFRGGCLARHQSPPSHSPPLRFPFRADERVSPRNWTGHRIPGTACVALGCQQSCRERNVARDVVPISGSRPIRTALDTLGWCKPIVGAPFWERRVFFSSRKYAKHPANPSVPPRLSGSLASRASASLGEQASRTHMTFFLPGPKPGHGPSTTLLAPL